MQNINEIEELIKLISKLPGLGPKSAKRIVLRLMNDRDQLIKPLANVLAQIYKNVSRCKNCGSLKSRLVGCDNCENSKKKFPNRLGSWKFEPALENQYRRKGFHQNLAKLFLTNRDFPKKRGLIRHLIVLHIFLVVSHL